MSKRNIIFICVAVTVVITLAFVVYFAIIRNDNKGGVDNIDKIIITKYDDDFEPEKTIEITDKKDIKDLKKIYNNCSLEQDENTATYGIGNDVKLDFQNGKIFIVQLDLEEYCYYENEETNTKLVIKMPEGLLQKINEILQQM